MRKDERDRINIIKDSAVRKVIRIAVGDTVASDVKDK